MLSDHIPQGMTGPSSGQQMLQLRRRAASYVNPFFDYIMTSILQEVGHLVPRSNNPGNITTSLHTP
jgi:hypothetical protein